MFLNTRARELGFDGAAQFAQVRGDSTRGQHRTYARTAVAREESADSIRTCMRTCDRDGWRILAWPCAPQSRLRCATATTGAEARGTVTRRAAGAESASRPRARSRPCNPAGIDRRPWPLLRAGASAHALNRDAAPSVPRNIARDQAEMAASVAAPLRRSSCRSDTASATCPGPTRSQPARSAIVRATLSTR